MISNRQARREERVKRLVELLRRDSRMSMTALALEVQAGVSTVFDDLQHIRKLYSFTIVPLGKEI